MGNRPNFFKMLRLDPGEMNQNVIEKCIQDKKNECNRIRSDAPQAKIREANAFRIYEEEIRRVLGDKHLRDIEAAERRKQIKDEERQLDGMLRMLKSRGSYTPRDIKNITSKLTEFDEATVEGRIKRAGILLESKGNQKKPEAIERPKTSDAEAQGIENDLLGLQLNSLYEFLEQKTSKKSSQTQLRAAYDAKKLALEKMVRGQDKHKVWSALLAHVNTHLLDPVNKERYDNYLDDRELKAVVNFIKLRAGDSKLLTEEAVNDIVREAHVPNVTAERTIQFIEQWVARTNGWTLLTTSGVTAANLLTCGFCGVLAQESRQSKCQDCGRPLRMACPNRDCKASVATECECCPQCGCTTGDAPYVEDLVRLARAHLDRDDEASLQEVQSLTLQILAVWPNYQVGTELAAEVKRIRIERDSKKRAREQKLEKDFSILNSLLSKRRLLAADRMAQQLKIEGMEIDAATLRQIAQGLGAAKKARQDALEMIASGRTEDAVDKLYEAIAICDDYDEARIALASSPPMSPTKLLVEPRGYHNRLIWQVPAVKPNTSYVVIRKENGLPDGKNDGEKLAEVTGTRFDDTTVEFGRVYYYAVYATRGRVCSVDAALSKAVLRPGKLQGLAATGINGEVNLRWILPYGCKQVRITREPGESTRIFAGSEFCDRGLEIGQTYQYSVVPLYDHPETGQRLAIRGEEERFDVIISRKPLPVMDLKSSLKDDQIFISWTPPAVGKVEIRISKTEPSVQQGDLISLAEITSIGSRIQDNGNGEARSRLPESGQAYVVPLTVEGTTAIVGKWDLVANLPEVENLKSRHRVSGQIELTWDWPPGIDVVHVKTVRVLDNKELASIEMTRQAYARNENTCKVSYASTNVYSFTVSTKSHSGGLLSRGVTVTESLGKEIRIHYRVVSKKQRWFTFGTSRIQLNCDEPINACLQNVIIVGRPDRLPTGIADGETIATFPKVELKGTGLNLPIPDNRGFLGKLYLKLFLRDPDLHPGIRLVPAARNHLILTEK